VDVDAYHRRAGLNSAGWPHGSHPRQVAHDLVLDRVPRRAIGAAGAFHSRWSKTSCAADL